MDGAIIRMELASDVPPKRPIEDLPTQSKSLWSRQELLGRILHHGKRSNLIKLRDLQIMELLSLENSIDQTIKSIPS